MHLKKQTVIKVTTFGVGIALFIGALIYANADIPGVIVPAQLTFESARVIDVLEDTTAEDPNFPQARIGYQILLIEILTGEHRGAIGEIENHFGPTSHVDVRDGGRISVIVEHVDEQQFAVSLHNHERTGILIGSVILFLLVLGVIGGKKGIMSIIGLVFTLFSIIFLLVPFIMRGYHPVFITLIILSVTTIVSLILLSGWSRKTAIAIVGCIFGVVFAAFLAFFVGHFAGVNGFNMAEADELVSIGFFSNIRISGLFISGVLIAALGAVMDTAMTIASAAEELVVTNKKITKKQLFKSSMNIGRDAMGTMSNTLILAFVGTGLNMMIVILAFGISFSQLINMDFIAVEIIRSLAGSLGLVITVPVVAYLASVLLVDCK